MTEEFRVDMRALTEEERMSMVRDSELLFRINNTMPTSPERAQALRDLLGDRLGEGSTLTSPINLVSASNLSLGRNVYVGGGFLGMCRGGISIEDDVMIAANVSVLSNNHDLYDSAVLLCKPVRIRKGAWIGAGATILPGVTIGRYAVVGAAAVVTHDVGDYEVAVGNPAKVIKKLDADRFPKD